MKKNVAKILSAALSVSVSVVLMVGMVPTSAFAQTASAASAASTASAAGATSTASEASVAGVAGTVDAVATETAGSLLGKTDWSFKVLKRIAAVNYNGTITKAAYPISAITTASGAVVESISKDGVHTAGAASSALGGEGSITYEKVSGSQYLKITKIGVNSGKYTGKVTVSSKTPVGKHTITVRVTVAGDETHRTTSKDVEVTVQVMRFTPTITVTGKVSPNKRYNPLLSQTVVMIKSVQCAAQPLTYTLRKATNQDGEDVTKYFAVDPETGLTTFAAGTPRGTYKVQYKISSPAVDGYNANWRTATGTFQIV